MIANKYIVILLALILLNQPTPSCGQVDETGQISAATASEIDNVQKFLAVQDYEGALYRLDNTLQNTNLTPYEQATLFQMKGHAHYELNQYQETIQSFEDAISSGGLLESKTSQLRLNIAQLWILEGPYERGAEMLEQWGREGNALKSIHTEQIMQAYIKSDNYELALPWAERWFQDANPKERKHYELLNFLYNILGQNEKQVEIVKAMTHRWPDDKMLSDALALIYANNGQEREAFEVTRKYYLTGNPHRENDILRLVKYHSHYDMPYEAARILDEEIGAGRVAKTLKNKVWLSMLYQDAGYTSYAEAFFAEAVEMSDKIAAEDMRETLTAAQQAPIAEDFGIRSLYPDFVPPKIDRGPFKIVVSDRDAQPLVRIPPIMPKNAVKSGRCKLRFDVNRLGQPENILAQFCTEKLLERAAVESVEKWKYRPKIVDGRQKARTGVETTVRFIVTDTNGIPIPE